MMVATTRKASEDPGRLYSGERGETISLNNIVISVPPDRNRKAGQVQWPNRLPANPEEEFAVLDVGKITTEKQAHSWFRKNRNRKGQVVIFVHGFNNSYADAVFRFAQIMHDAGTDAAPILFTWPSRGSVFDYFYDKESTNYSRRALEDLILQVTRSPDIADVTILAHSMGTWLAAEALRGVAMREKSIPSKVRTVVLASPDIDVDVFRRQFIEMGPKRPLFAILTSPQDKALGLSRWLSGGVERIGGTDLRPYADVLAEMGVMVIDTSAIASGDPLGHTTFADSPEIVRLLGRRLAGQPMEGRAESISGRVGQVFANSAVIDTLRRDFSPSPGEIVDGSVSY